MPLKKSVKAQVHSLEARGRQLITVKQEPNPTSERRRGLNNGGQLGRQVTQRSRSENPLTRKHSRGGFTYLPETKQEPVTPPPMPEKTKIHLRQNQQQTSRQSNDRICHRKSTLVNQPIIPPLTNSGRNRKVKDVKAQRKTKPNTAASTRRPDQPLPDLPGQCSKQSSLKSSKSNNYEVLGSRSPPRGRLGLRGQNTGLQKRAKSTGPMQDTPGYPGRPRSRSRGEPEREVRRSNTRGQRDLKRTKSIERTSSTVEEIVPGIGAPMRPQMPSRQKSMVDLRDPVPLWAEREPNRGFQRHHAPIGNPIRGPHRPRMMRSATEHDIKVTNRRSIAAGPLEDYPPHIRQHLMRQHGIPPPGGFGGTPGLSATALRREEEIIRQINLDAQREFLMRRGFPADHPYISGEVSVHPELQGQLPFGGPGTRTIPMKPEDFHRFRPELWMHSHPHGVPHPHPNPVAFNDVEVLQNEMEIRRKKLMRHESQRGGAKVAPISGAVENNFSSLPWEEILPRRMEHLHHQALQSVGNVRDTLGDNHRPLVQEDVSSGSWFTGSPSRDLDRGKKMKSQKHEKESHWLLKQKPPPVVEPVRTHLSNPPQVRVLEHFESKVVLFKRIKFQSMPPLGSLKDSGIGGEDATRLSRSSTDRSSFGMILKDKFQKNPNMYFPGDQGDSGESYPSSRGKPNHLHNTRKEMEDQVAEMEILSDTDTLIHNMSEGSYDKDRLSMESGSMGKGSNRISSGNSSLSPHNSMEGSPRFRPDSTSIRPSSMPSSKKTIRNYTPKESSNMLREFEDQRKSVSSNEGKSSMDKMIDDFHRNLPTPPPDPREGGTKTNGTLNSQVSNWSVVSSSAASFDYQPGAKRSQRSSSTDNILPSVAEVDYDDVRVPPEGASSPKVEPMRPKTSKVLEEVEDLMMQSIEDQEDDFSNLRKLISEGRITGLNDKPPSFTPPTPPNLPKLGTPPIAEKPKAK